MLTRRLISVPVVLLLACLAIVLGPLLLLLALVLSLIPGLGSIHRATAFVLLFACLEVVALARLGWVGLTYRDEQARQAANYHVQFWWAHCLLRIGAWLYNISFSVTGEDAIAGPSAILVARHASVGDNVLPLVFFGNERNAPLRYILKKELTWLPTLDFGGHSLPNLFVDRSGSSTEDELDAVARLLVEAPSEDSLLIYPEGTRYTRAKQDKIGQKPGMGDQVERWPDLLPPRLGGLTRLLQVNPGKDVVFLCHAGFEGASSIPDLANGSWVNQHVRVHFWRVPYAEIDSDLQAFIFAQWDEMQRQLVRLHALGNSATQTA